MREDRRARSSRPVSTASCSSGEQSNTSLVFGEESILKVFRRLSPGPNPDLEVTTALHRLGSSQVAEPLGWIETRLEGVPTSLAILSRYLRLATDGWTLAATSVRDLYASAGHARGRRRAATSPGSRAGSASPPPRSTPTWPPRSAPTSSAPTAVGELTERMFRKLDLAVGRGAGTGQARRHDQRRLRRARQAQRARSRCSACTATTTWARCCAPRPAGWSSTSRASPPPRSRSAAPARPPLRDVAGMLRSFDYAARHQLIGHPGPGRAAATWRATGCAGTPARSAPVTPRPAGSTRWPTRSCSRALQLDKAVYEVLYEARHRPSWLPIPLDSLAEF